MPLKFRVRLIPLLATVALVILGVSLAQWQTRRAHEKEQIDLQMHQRGLLEPLILGAKPVAAADVAYRHVKVSGQFVAAWPLYLDNRALHGAAGFYVMMPFKIEGSDMHVLVARGWQPRNAQDRSKMPPLATPQGVVQIEGIARENIDRVMQLGQPTAVTPGAILQNVSAADVAQQARLPMQDLILEQTSASPDGLQRDWPLPSAGADKHRAYAFQWYALSLMAIIFFVVTGYRRGKISQ
ncbi:SURF1 family protein [Undibacterium sp.]|uniref:SURF1 family protein n=1 Tax=Undibacterium sp. TaxID=1914977 RepID=UPI002C87BD4C|nr:SURF1 family protein [Undibacterium sp.]HTD06058.1 SURF1 family protein [Undibacterium sp.]